MAVAVAAVLLGVLLLVVLVEGKAGAADGDGGGDTFLDLVGVPVVGVLLGLVLLVHGVRSRCDGAQLGELLHVLVVLLLLAPVDGGDLGGRIRGFSLLVVAEEVMRHFDGAKGSCVVELKFRERSRSSISSVCLLADMQINEC